MTETLTATTQRDATPNPSGRSPRLRIVGPAPGPSRRPLAAPPTAPDRVARAVVHAASHLITGGTVHFVDPGGSRARGSGRADRYGAAPLRASVHVHDPAAYRRLITGGSVGLGESYADGAWDADDLTAFLRILSRTMRTIEPARGRLHRTTRWLSEPARRLRRADADRDRRNVQAHYDLSNDFFELLLDDTMLYSCADFETADQPLADASRRKIDRLATRLALGPEDHVLEVGSGWGGFALHAASVYGCRVTTTTVSDAQHRHVRQRVRATGLDDRVTVLDRDYRDLDGRYDAVVSIEMIEAVDWRDYPTFFSALDRLLTPTGRVGMQAILIPGQRFERAKNRRDFIKEVIFPGGCLPSLGALLAAAERTTDLSLTDVTDLGHHYGETLRRWRANLERSQDALPDLGLDERFARLWSFYLAYCEAGFDERYITAAQLVLARPGWSPPGPRFT